MSGARPWAGAAAFALAIALGIALAVSVIILALSDASRAETIVAKLAGVAIGAVASYLGGQAISGRGDTSGDTSSDSGG